MFSKQPELEKAKQIPVIYMDEKTYYFIWLLQQAIPHYQKNFIPCTITSKSGDEVDATQEAIKVRQRHRNGYYFNTDQIVSLWLFTFLIDILGRMLYVILHIKHPCLSFTCFCFILVYRSYSTYLEGCFMWSKVKRCHGSRDEFISSLWHLKFNSSSD